MRLNTTAFAVCTITVGASLKDGPSISSIQYIGPTTEDIIMQINSSLGTLTIQAIISVACVTVVSIIGYQAFKSIQEDYRKRRLTKLANDALESSSTLRSDEVINLDSYLCEACNAEMRGVLLMPCKHILYCRSCWDAKINKTACERCHKPVSSTTIIYLT